MSPPSDDWHWRRAAPKKPPPADGIKLKKAGTTWWGQRWIEALQNVLRGDSGRLARGRTYARAGRTHDLAIDAGKVTAKVTGSAARPYAISIELQQLTAAAWDAAIASMVEQAQFAVELLAGQMPQQIDEAFRAASTSLFPTQRSELTTSCSCPDYGDPCKHIAATHYVLGEALDRDPFLLFELRGRSKAQVLDALRVARAGVRVADERAPKRTKTTRAKQTAPETEPTGVKLGKQQLASYDQAPEPLPALHFSFEATVTHGAVLRQLGAPAAWSGETAPAELLAPIVHAAAERARRMALAEPEETANLGALEPTPTRTPTPTRPKPAPRAKRAERRARRRT